MVAKSTKEKTKKTSEDSKEKQEEPSIPRLRIKLKAYDHRLIDKAAQQIVDTAMRQGVNVVGPIPLPTEVHKFSVNRSTFVHEQSKEQFEMRVHKRLIDVLAPSKRIVDSFQNLNLPVGVEIEIKV